MLFLAQDQGLLQPDLVRLVETPSASASLRALANRTVDGAGLTLDEVLTARSRGLPLVVVVVVDVSMGADQVLLRPDPGNPYKSLRGLTIGFEPGATAAVMLQACLARQRLGMSEVRTLALAVDQHVEAYLQRKVDAVVSYEPFSGRLRDLGALPIFTSAEIPGRIVDTLAVRAEVLESHARQLRHLVAGHFAGLAFWQRESAGAAPVLAARLQLQPSQVVSTLAGIRLPDLSANRHWLLPDVQDAAAPRLAGVANDLMKVMVDAHLLPGLLELGDLMDGRFLP